MQPFWITFSDGSAACCEGQSMLDAKLIAERLTGKTSVKAEVLPYPAHPVIWQFNHPVYGVTPTFCFSPSRCVGRTACQRSISCVE